jgi:CDP-diacylglycerol--glycerol-3-phosphate 3-phosphatidyltransferase
MAVVIASAGLSDEEFLAAFDNCTLSLSSFRHGDHLRLAWLQVRNNTLDEALALVRHGIQKYAAHHGVSHIFHETVTAAWVKLIATHHEATFEDFVRDNEHRLNLALLHRFWTPDALNSQEARLGWLPPDRQALPA